MHRKGCNHRESKVICNETHQTNSKGLLRRLQVSFQGDLQVHGDVVRDNNSIEFAVSVVKSPWLEYSCQIIVRSQCCVTRSSTLCSSSHRKWSGPSSTNLDRSSRIHDGSAGLRTSFQRLINVASILSYNLIIHASRIWPGTASLGEGAWMLA